MQQTSDRFDREKLRTVVLYTVEKCEAEDLGAVKLNKVLYYLDMLNYAYEGQSVTGSVYRKRPFGPTCDQLLDILNELQKDGSITIEEVDYFGYRKKVFALLKQQQSNRLSHEECRLLDDVIDFVCQKNSAKTISELSHNRAWDMVDYGEKMPYFSVLSIFPREVSGETIRWAIEEGQKLENSRQNADSLGSSNYGDFRNRLVEKMSTD